MLLLFSLTCIHMCFLQQISKLLMKQAFADLAKCEGHEGDAALGCGTQLDGVCNVCCADGGCNYGTCRDITRKMTFVGSIYFLI